MPTGDSLTVLLFLAATAIAAVIGAITAPVGWRSRSLWGMAVAFVAAIVAWLLAPAANPMFTAIKPFVIALVESNALATVGIVGVVALMIGGRPANGRGIDLATLEVPREQLAPSFAARTASRVKWVPDISLKEGVRYIWDESTWLRRQSYPTVEDAILELRSLLRNSQITAWGKIHPDDEEPHQISSGFWLNSSITLETDYAFSSNKSVAAYEVMLCLAEMKLVWPPKGQQA